MSKGLFEAPAFASGIRDSGFGIHSDFGIVLAFGIRM
jgi:hypothetical protein